jgi:hypothetical protein
MAIDGQKLVCRAPGAIAWCLMTMSASSLAKWVATEKPAGGESCARY